MFIVQSGQVRISKRTTREEVVFATLDRGDFFGEFMGIPPTRRSVELLGCSIFTLGSDGLVSEEIVYFDAAALLHQIGALPESAYA